MERAGSGTRGGDLLERLSGLDATFLYLETPRMHLHVSAVVVFDPATAAAPGQSPGSRDSAGGAGGGPGGASEVEVGAFSFDRLKAVIESRLHLLPPFRRRAVQVPFHLDHPVWVDDPDFDLDYHLRRLALPAPGGVHELCELAADLISRPLDLDRPLWEIYVLEGLQSGGAALVAKAHHAAIDGVSGTELAALLFDLEPGGTPVPPPEHPWRPERVPSERDMLVKALGPMVCRPVAIGRLLGKSVGALFPPVEASVHDAHPHGMVPDDVHQRLPLALRAPKTSFNSSLSSHRRVAFAEVSLADVKRVRELAGGTVNDVVLTGCAGALRGYLESREELPSESLVALVPISVRRPSEKGQMGNRVAAMLIELGTDIEDPCERLRFVSARTTAGKDRLEGLGSTLMAEWAEQLTPLLAAPTARVISGSKLFARVPVPCNVIISNVPGPDFPLYASGCRMAAIHPFGPVVEGVGLNITVMSYLGTMYFGILACRDLVPAIQDVATCLEDSFRELVRVAEDRARVGNRSRTKARRAVTGLRPGAS